MDDVTELNLLQKPGLLLTVDYSQAFDIISKDCMQGVFEKKRTRFWSRLVTAGSCPDVQYKKLCELLWMALTFLV